MSVKSKADIRTDNEVNFQNEMKTMVEKINFLLFGDFRTCLKSSTINIYAHISLTFSWMTR